MRVLVTGAGGFVGANVVRQLMIEGHEVVAVDRQSSSLQRLASGIPGITTALLDLDDTQAVQQFLKVEVPEGLIHLAWYANPEDYLSSNSNIASLAMTATLIQTAVALGCRRLVVGGSCAEYGVQNRLLLESDPVDARTLYAACKHSAWLVSSTLAAQASAQLAWARIFHIHGPFEDQRRLIPWVARQIRAGVRVPLTDGAQIRDHLHVADVAAGLITLLTSGATGISNICSGQPVTLRHVLETVGDILNGRELLDFGARPHRPNETMFLAGNADHLRSLGWRPAFGLADGLADSLREPPTQDAAETRQR